MLHHQHCCIRNIHVLSHTHMTHLQQTRIKRTNDALSAIKDCHAHMTHIQQLKIALPYGRTYINLRFKATDH